MTRNIKKDISLAYQACCRAKASCILMKRSVLMNKLNEIYEKMLSAASVFGKTEQDMVYGEGDRNAKIMLIGEAPGAEETKLQRPFVGKAGKNLDEFLEVICQRRSDIYITNVVKFRPFKVSEKGRMSNRPPKKDEIETMLPWLLNEIETVAPDIVVTLGNVPLKAVSGDKKITIGSVHAKKLTGKAGGHEFVLFPLYHPASIIYNRELGEVYEQDLLVLKTLLKTMM